MKRRKKENAERWNIYSMIWYLSHVIKTNLPTPSVLTSSLSLFSQNCSHNFSHASLHTRKFVEMSSEATNSTLDFIDLSVNKSIDFIANSIYQLLQLIFCLMSIMVVGKLINFFVSKTTPAENEVENVKLESEAEIEPEVVKEKQENAAKELTGWDSEPINDDPLPHPLEIPPTSVTAKVMKRQFRRKCMSVGPIMLTPNSQIVRTLNVEEREERYRYDILPLEATSQETTTAENVCVPYCFCFSLTNDVINFSTHKIPRLISRNQMHVDFFSLFSFPCSLLTKNSFATTSHVHKIYF